MNEKEAQQFLIHNITIEPRFQRKWKKRKCFSFNRLRQISRFFGSWTETDHGTPKKWHLAFLPVFFCYLAMKWQCFCANLKPRWQESVKFQAKGCASSIPPHWADKNLCWLWSEVSNLSYSVPKDSCEKKRKNKEHRLWKKRTDIEYFSLILFSLARYSRMNGGKRSGSQQNKKWKLQLWRHTVKYIWKKV